MQQTFQKEANAKADGGVISSHPGKNGRHLADDIFRCILVDEKLCIFINISLKLPNIGSDNGLGPNRRQAIVWTNAEPIHRRIYPALGGDELM